MNKYDIVEDIVYIYYQRNPDEIRIHSREHKYTNPRHLTWYFLYTLTNATLLEIGEHYGYDHQSPRNAVRRIKDLIMTEAYFRSEVTKLRKEISKELISPTEKDNLPVAPFIVKMALSVSFFRCKACDYENITQYNFGVCPKCNTKHILEEI